MGWYHVAAYEYDPFERVYRRRLYSRGPMHLSSSAADVEFLDTTEAFWGNAVFMWEWDNGWQLRRSV